MPRIQQTRTVKIAMFFLRAYLVLLFGLILCKGVGVFFTKDIPATKAQEPAITIPAKQPPKGP